MRASGSEIGMICAMATLVLATLVCLSGASRTMATLSSYEYDEFHAFHRQGEATVNYAERKAIFDARKQQVMAHNARKESWTLTLNRFADFTPTELKSTHGLQKGAHWDGAGESSFLQTGGVNSETQHNEIDVSVLAKTVDWTSQMDKSNFVHDQGACGSCWAHAAVAALEAHAELSMGIKDQLSTQEIIDCSPNPRKCGGDGGCKGSTGEIALEYARKHGIVFENAYKTGGCQQANYTGGIKINSFVRLPTNKASHLMQAMATQGPVVLSIDANNLHLYNGGVFSGCEPDTVVNHAVLGVGYGTDAKSGKMFYNIKNSWAETWGEKGYIRVERHDADNAFCGVDKKPEDGVFCAKHPDSVPVCGMCGITSDSAYPVFAKKASNLRAVKSVATKVKKGSVASKVAAFEAMNTGNVNSFGGDVNVF